MQIKMSVLFTSLVLLLLMASTVYAIEAQGEMDTQSLENLETGTSIPLKSGSSVISNVERPIRYFDWGYVQGSEIFEDREGKFKESIKVHLYETYLEDGTELTPSEAQAIGCDIAIYAGDELPYAKQCLDEREIGDRIRGEQDWDIYIMVSKKNYESSIAEKGEVNLFQTYYFGKTESLPFVTAVTVRQYPDGGYDGTIMLRTEMYTIWTSPSAETAIMKEAILPYCKRFAINTTAGTFSDEDLAAIVDENLPEELQITHPYFYTVIPLSSFENRSSSMGAMAVKYDGYVLYEERRVIDIIDPEKLDEEAEINGAISNMDLGLDLGAKILYNDISENADKTKKINALLVKNRRGEEITSQEWLDVTSIGYPHNDPIGTASVLTTEAMNCAYVQAPGWIT